MKKILETITVTSLSLMTICALGQDTVKTGKLTEYFLTFNSPINISMTFKRQLKNNTFIKIGLINNSANSYSTYPNTITSFFGSSLSFSSGLNFGFEFRRIITDKFAFFHGPNASFTYQANIFKIDNPALPEKKRKTITQIYNFGIPYTLGLVYQLSSHFFISAEMNPELFLSYGTLDDRPNPENNYKYMSGAINYRNNIGIVSIVYRK